MKRNTAFSGIGIAAHKKSVFIHAAFIFLLLLAVSLPFELITPLWMIGPFSITNLELVLFLTLAFTAVSLLSLTRARLSARSRFFQDTQWVWPDRYWLWLLPFVGGLLLAALLAPQFQANALKAALRLMAGILLALAVLQIVRRWPNGRMVIIALLSGGFIAATIGWWEITYSELAWTGLFRTHITRLGAILRLTGTFDYANQAAMFLEATLPFWIAAGWSVSQAALPRRFKWPLLASLFLLTLFYLQAILLTLSRASLIATFTVCMLLVVLLALRRPAGSRKMAAWWLGLAVVTAVLVAGNSLHDSQFRLRLQGGNVDDWYRAQIMAPPALEMVAGTTIEVPVTITNQGVLVWRSQGRNPILLGARILNERGTAAYSELRWSFPDSVEPQATVQVIAPLTAPPVPGIYELRWDVVHENVTWFGTKSGLYATSQVTVLPADRQADQLQSEALVLSERAAWDYAGPVPNRTVLWLLGLQMIGERPLFGIGLDNFRLIYGQRLGQPYADDTVHTNNLYLEILVSLGIVGMIPFVVWSGILLLDLLRTLRRPDVTMWQAALAAGLLTFYIHGFFDFFMMFYATGLLFWLLAGLWICEKRGYAHRI
jgi:hypothetical protein